jgi:hypothetical protein
MNTKTNIVTAAAVIKAAGSALSAGLKAGDALRAYVGMEGENPTAAQMAGFEVAYKVLLADPAYTGAKADVQAKIRRLMTDAVRGKAGYSVSKAGAIEVKAAIKADKAVPKAADAKPADPTPSNAAAIKVVAGLANTFLPEADRAKFAECLAMISSKLATAKVGKK